MNENIFLNQMKQTGTGLAFIVFPLLFIFAFAVHPGLLQPRLLSSEEIILRAHGNGLLQFGHVLVTLCTGLLIVVALHFMRLLERSTGAWVGFIGAVIAILGAIIQAADKGALCLTMSAFDTLSEIVFVQFMLGGCLGPGVVAHSKKPDCRSKMGFLGVAVRDRLCGSDGLYRLSAHRKRTLASECCSVLFIYYGYWFVRLSHIQGKIDCLSEKQYIERSHMKTIVWTKYGST